MATGPGGGVNSAGHGHLRASHADREQVVGTLKAAFVQGRLTKEELEARAGQAFAARTYAELAALTVDLPAGLTNAMPPATRAHARKPVSNAAKAGIWLVIAIVVPMLLSFPTGGGVLFLMLTPFYFMALAFLGAEIAASRHKKRSQLRQRPPGQAPGLGSQAYQCPSPAGPGRPLPPVDPGQRHVTEAARRCLPVRVHRRCATGGLAG